MSKKSLPFEKLLEGVQLLQDQLASLSRRVDLIQKALVEDGGLKPVPCVRLIDGLAKWAEGEKRVKKLRVTWLKSIKGTAH